jgi:DegV family protein with EDD domain
MSKVAVVTDSVACLPPEIVKEYTIRVVPCLLTIDGKAYRDEVDISADDFWKRYHTMKQISTSGASPGGFLEAFKEVGKEAKDIICITISNALSISYKSAIQAREIIRAENPEVNIEVFDSKLVLGAQGYIVMEAARAAKAGKNAAEIGKIVQDMIGRAKWVAGLRTKQTAKTGRVPESVYEGTAEETVMLIAQLHGTGMVEDAGKANGNLAAFQRMMEIISENVLADRPLHVMVHYTDRVEDGQQLLEMANSRFQCIETYLTRYTPVLGGSSGPATAVAFYA